jgi:large subunit ribosomal protein L17
MRHRKAHRKLGRVADHRIAMFRNQAHALIKYEHIETTVPRAKELRPFVERLITIAKRGNAGGDANGKMLHARRLVLRDLPDQAVVGKLFDTIAPRFAARPGGYTRIIRLGYRRGDSAEVAQLELLGSEFDPKAAPKETKTADTPPKTKGVADRLRAAAERLRGKKEDDSGSKKAARGASTKGRSAKRTTPQKSG